MARSIARRPNGKWRARHRDETGHGAHTASAANSIGSRTLTGAYAKSCGLSPARPPGRHSVKWPAHGSGHSGLDMTDGKNQPPSRQPPTPEGICVSALHSTRLQLGIIDASVYTFPRTTVWCTPKG